MHAKGSDAPSYQFDSTLLTLPQVFKCSRKWVTDFVRRDLKWVVRRGTGAAQTLPENYKDLIEDMFMRLAINVATKNIPMDFTYCMDETFALHTPCAASTLEEKGTRHVNIVGKDKKEGCTVLLTCKVNGQMLPLQVRLPCNYDCCMCMWQMAIQVYRLQPQIWPRSILHFI